MYENKTDQTEVSADIFWGRMSLKLSKKTKRPNTQTHISSYTNEGEEVFHDTSLWVLLW